MRLSYSRVDTFTQCPFKFKCRYIDELQTLKDQEPTNPLYLGTAVHRAIETNNIDLAIEEYKSNYYVMNDLIENEIIKLRAILPKVLGVLPKGIHEVKVETNDFLGFIDLLVPTDKSDTFDIYDFKYSNNIEHYMNNSKQLSIYKYYSELFDVKIRALYFVFIPKAQIRQKKDEDLYQFRQRLNETIAQQEVQIKKIDYDENAINEFKNKGEKIEKEKQFEKNQTQLCKWCEFNQYCQKGEKFMLLPSTERRTTGSITKRKIWIYGQAFSGKTTMLDGAPNPLNLNTDGNIQFVTMPFIAIKDTYDGRIKVTAWENFKSAIEELEKKNNDFKTIIVDLIEDTREMCRLYEYDRLGIQHESDSSFGKGWDIIKTEYLSTIRRFFNLDYENLVIVSHEIQNDVTLKNGSKITTIKPNIQDNLANKLGGMVDMVGRVVVDNGERYISFKSDEYTFCGGRINESKNIPLKWDELIKLYDNFDLVKNKEEVKETTIEEVKATEEPKESSGSTERKSRRRREED